MKSRTIVAPQVDSEFSKAGKLAYWKQILPQGVVHFTRGGKREQINFDQAYLTDLATAFNDKALDQTPFMLADADNKHTMQPEHQRGECTEMRLASKGEEPGLYAKIAFPTKAAAKAVLNNPKLGVSARIREGISRSDGSFVKRGIIHVLGTLDPQVTGMAPWVPATADLSFDPADNVLDLSNESYEQEPTVAKNKSEKAVVAPELDLNGDIDAQIEAFSEEELDAFLQANAEDESAATISNETSTEADEEDEQRLVGAGADLSATARRDIELATSRANVANDRANEALRRAADAEFREYRSKSIAAGIPPAMIDLAEPVLNRADPMVIDLSNDGGDELDVSDIVRQLLTGYEGTVDLSNEKGHFGVTAADGDPDREILDQWNSEA